MPSRSRSPEKRQPSHLREIPNSDQVRGGADVAARRLDRVNPQTPPVQRFASSTYSSPGSILGREEDAVILELSPRYLLAGIEGESCSQCKINFSPPHDRRIGDYREWLPGYTRAQEDTEEWGKTHELWRNNIEALNMDLIGDRLERYIRDAYNKYLLVDAGLARIVLVLPSIVPHPVLEIIITTLFQRWKYPSITLLPAPTMAMFSAGLRSALVIDIAWEETTVTVVHEYRELHVRSSTRAMKPITLKLARMLHEVRTRQQDGQMLNVDLPLVEEMLTRALPNLNFALKKAHTDEDTKLSAEDDAETATKIDKQDFEVEWPSESGTKFVELSYEDIFVVVEEVIFTGADDEYADDDELAISRLAYDVLAAVSSDIRMACLPRVIFMGQLAANASLTERIINDLRQQIETRTWSAVQGKRLNAKRSGLVELAQARTTVADARHGIEQDSVKDYVEDRIRQLKGKRNHLGFITPSPREVKSLGAWAGASLLTSLKVRGFVEIEKDRYLSHGLSGASRETDISVVAQPQRISSFGLPKANKAQDKTSWTLAGWG